MKIKLIAVLLLSSFALAGHPRDFVPDDAIAVLSIRDGLTVNSILNTVSEQAGEKDSANVVDTFLNQFFENPSVIDLSAELLFIVAPTVLEEGQKPKGMFGPMPHSIVICKAKDGEKIKVTGSSGLKTTATVDGWFIATGADKWTTRSSKSLSPILSSLPSSQISFTLKFETLWKQFGPIAQMVGGMGIGTLNRPGPDGVISPETKKATAVARKGFIELTKWCATVKDISIWVDFENYELVANIEVDLKEGKTPTINNRSLIEMSSMLNDDMIQYAMSNKIIQKLIEMDLQSLSALDPTYAGPPPFMTETFKIMSKLLEDSVFSYGLNSENGITIASLSEVTNQNKYFEDIPNIINEMTGFFLEEYKLGLSLTNTPNTWDVEMVGSEENQDILNAFFHKDDQLRFGKQDNNRIAMAFGPTTWRPFSMPHATPLSLVLKPHAETVDIDFALSIDARLLLSGVAEIAKLLDYDDAFSITCSPSAKCSLLFGTTTFGTLIELKADLYGIATLVHDGNEAKEQTKQKASLGHGIGTLAGQAIDGDTGSLVGGATGDKKN